MKIIQCLIFLLFIMFVWFINSGNAWDSEMKTLDTLTPNFKGDSIIDIYNKYNIKSRDTNQDNVSSENKPTSNDMNYDAEYAFSININSQYNERSEICEVTCEVSKKHSKSLHGVRWSILVDSNTKGSDSYIEKNVYSINTKVYASITEKYLLAILNYNSLPKVYQPKDWLPPRINYAFNVKYENTKTAFFNLKGLIICKPQIPTSKAPYTINLEVPGRPTIEKHESNSVNFHYLFVRVLELWIYNDHTGEIYLKEKL